MERICVDFSSVQVIERPSPDELTLIAENICSHASLVIATLAPSTRKNVTTAFFALWRGLSWIMRAPLGEVYNFAKNLFEGNVGKTDPEAIIGVADGGLKLVGRDFSGPPPFLKYDIFGTPKNLQFRNLRLVPRRS